MEFQSRSSSQPFYVAEQSLPPLVPGKKQARDVYLEAKRAGILAYQLIALQPVPDTSTHNTRHLLLPLLFLSFMPHDLLFVTVSMSIRNYWDED